MQRFPRSIGASDVLVSHYAARGMLEEVEVDGRPLKIPALAPKLERTPGRTTWPGPDAGAHNTEVLRDLLGLSDEDLDELRTSGVI